MLTSVPQTHPPGDGWHDWCWFSPWGPYSAYHLVEIWRRGWRDTQLTNPHAMHPMTNVAGLWWRAPGPRLEPEVANQVRHNSPPRSPFRD